MINIDTDYQNRSNVDGMDSGPVENKREKMKLFFFAWNE